VEPLRCSHRKLLAPLPQAMGGEELHMRKMRFELAINRVSEKNALDPGLRFERREFKKEE
jgi:hypothetical protein